MITFNAGSTPKRYYANIIDQAGNKGGCGFIFSYPSVPAVVPEVTGLTHDNVPQQIKRWTWGCNTQNCTYRHAITNRATHTFDDDDGWGATTEETTGTSRGDGKWYIHVQARTTEGGESRVRTVYATIDRTRPATPTQNDVVYLIQDNGDEPDQIIIQISNLDPGDTVKVYTMVNDRPSFQFDPETVASDGDSVSVVIPTRSTSTDYCAKVIDRAKNESARCGFILTYPFINPRLVLKTPMPNPSPNYLHDRPTFTVEKARGSKVYLYADSGNDCSDGACCENRNNVKLMGSKTCPTTGACTIQVGENVDKKLDYPEGVGKHKTKNTFYLKKEYEVENNEKRSSCSSIQNGNNEATEEANKRNVVYNLWTYKPIHVGGYKWACHLSKLGEIRCWAKWHNDSKDVEDIFKKCLPSGGTHEGTEKWLASFNPLNFGDPINLGCRDSDPATGVCPSNEKYKALAVSVGKDWADDGNFDKAFVCAILDDQKVKCWGGANEKGQLGQGNITPINDPSEIKPVALNNKVKAISSGRAHSCVILDSNGVDNNKVKCWGDNSKAQLGLNKTSVALPAIGDTEPLSDANAKKVDEATTTPQNDDNIQQVKAISAGEFHTCAILLRTGNDNNKVKCWGDNTYYQLGLANTDTMGGSNQIGDSLFNTSTVANPTVKHLATGSARTCIITASDSKVICRSNYYVYNSIAAADPLRRPEYNGTVDDSKEQTFSFDDKIVVGLALGGDHTCALFESGEVNCFRQKLFSPPRTQKKHLNKDLYIGTSAVDLNTNNTVQYMDSTRDDVCVSLKDGQVKCWGDEDDDTHDRPELCENNAPSS